jgi:crotonobetainyl-CoA:carnitine CoA-transferase CaiB-like acyl-CoA transferase
MRSETPTRSGSRDPFSAPAGLFATRDGHVYIHGGTDSLFPRLCAAIDRPDLVLDERLQTVAGRLAATEELERAVMDWTSIRRTDEVAVALNEVGVPFGPVADTADAVASDQLRSREMLATVDHPTLGPLTVIGLPIKLSRTPGAIRTAPPTVGQDNDRAYRELLGLDARRIAELIAAGAI